MICDTLHSNETGLSATRGTLTRLLGAAVSPEILNSLTSWATWAAVAFICCAKSMVARFQTNSPGLLDVGDAVLPGSRGKSDDRGVVIEAVEKAVWRRVEVALGIGGGDPADGAWRDDGIEGIVLEAVAARRLVIVQIFLGHAGPLFPSLRGANGARLRRAR